MKIGYIDYLNCYPFYYKMFEKEPLEGIKVVPWAPYTTKQDDDG